MPNFPLVDAHVHLWNPQHFAIPWLADSGILERLYLPADYRTFTGCVDISAFVYVEVDVAPQYALLEAQWAHALAAAEPRLQAIVAHAPLEYGSRVASYLAALRMVGPRIKGVRRLLQSEADPHFCLQDSFIQGVRLLPSYDFSFDICIKHDQLQAATELVRRCPEVDFVLDHIAKPDIRNKRLDPWREQLANLAQLPNVVCKISGVVTEAHHRHWTVEQIAPYIMHALDVFGEDRILFGSDWPVVRLAAEHERWVEALETLTSGMSDVARQKLWAENARRVYKLQ